MRQPVSLFARTILVSFACTCAVLAAGFFCLHAAIKSRIERGLKQNLLRSERQIDQREAEYNRRNAELLGILSNDPSLKAAIGLLSEHFTPAAQAQARDTVEEELREISRRLDSDVLMVLSPRGEVIASVGAQLTGQDEPRALKLPLGGPTLARFGGSLFTLTTIPINLQNENLGRLAVGRKFELRAPDGFAGAVLLDRGGIAASTLPAAWTSKLLSQLQTDCRENSGGCEVRLNHNAYLMLPMRHAGVGQEFQLYCLASIDNAMREFTRGLRGAFLITGLGGMIMALLLAAFASATISKPLASLASQLEHSGGADNAEFRADSSILEVNAFAGALNRAISARQQVENDLRKAKEAAEAANRAKGDFLANVSHELRTPMNGILGLTELTLESELTTDQRECLGMVKSSADSLLGIINDILDFARIDAGKFGLDPAPFNLRSAVEQALVPLRFRASEKGLHLLCEVDSGVPEILIGDAGRLRQVLINLVGNAIKFTGRGHVRVRAGVERTNDVDACLHFAVEDTGIGIPAEKQAIIFEPFSQADTSTTRSYGGAGLGLTISSSLIEIMQGRIWLESELGRGSCFHFTACFGWPDSDPSAGPTREAAHPSSTAGKSKSFVPA